MRFTATPLTHTLQLAGGLSTGILAIKAIWIPTMTSGGRRRFERDVAVPIFENMDEFSKEFYETKEELAKDMVCECDHTTSNPASPACMP